MQWFYNLKIGTKLLAGFIVVALIAGIIGFVGISNLRNIAKLDAELYELCTVPIADLNDTSLALQKIRVAYRDIVLDKTLEDKNKRMAKLQELDKVMGEGLAKIEKTIKAEEIKKEFANLKEAQTRFAPIRDKIINLSMQGKNDEALAFMRLDSSYAAAKAVDDSMSKLVDFKVDQAKKRSDGNTAAASTAVNASLIILIIGVVLAIGLGVFISRIIVLPLRTGLDVANRLADGDLTTIIETARKDETGQLQATMRNMFEKLKEVVGDVRSASDNVAAGSQQLSSSSEEMSQGAQEQAAAAEEASSSMEQMSSNIKQNADNASRPRRSLPGNRPRRAREAARRLPRRSRP